MGRLPCCDKSSVKKGAWTAEEDAKILAYVSTHGLGNWTSVPKKAGLKRCGKSCRLRYTNYLRPDLKRESFTPQEEDLIINLHETLGSRWSLIANYLPGRTDNDVKNYWNTKLKKKLSQKGIDPITHKPFSQIIESLGGYPVGLVDNHTRTNSTQSTITQVGCLNRDLKHAIMHSPTFMCKQESYLTPRDSTGYDLLTQLHAIKLVSDMSNPYNGTTFYPRATDTCSSSSSAISPPPLPPPQPSEELSWCDFLVDDVVMCIDETNKVVDDVAIVGDNITSKVSGGVGQSGALKAESVDVSGSEMAFVDSLLDQSGGMSWDLSGVFVEDGFDFSQSGGGF